MGASARMFNSSSPIRVFSITTRLHLTRRPRHGSNLFDHGQHFPSAIPSFLLPPSFYQLPQNQNLHGSIIPTSSACSLFRSRSCSPIPLPGSNSLPLEFLPTASRHFHHHSTSEFVSKSDPNHEVFYRWRKSTTQIDGGAAGLAEDRGSAVTVVLLGWMGGRPKHLDKYTSLYLSRGFNAVTFAVPVSDVLWLDLGKYIEARIQNLTEDLVAWVRESDVRQRRLIFHAFSNTGWIVYGIILGYLDGRPEILERIKGLIVDSGAGSPLSPKVWAGGFGTAMLQSSSSITKTQGNLAATSTSMHKLQEKGPELTEILLLFILEKLFSMLLLLPDLRSKLLRTVSRLSEEVHCPQLYLYSTADKLVPYSSVEMFIEKQRMKGKTVWSYNFVTSPHVDHYRNFPDLYSSKVNSFLDECLKCEAQAASKLTEKKTSLSNVI